MQSCSLHVDSRSGRFFNRDYLKISFFLQSALMYLPVINETRTVYNKEPGMLPLLFLEKKKSSRSRETAVTYDKQADITMCAVMCFTLFHVWCDIDLILCHRSKNVPVRFPSFT
jgi:hypothetical protein